MNLNFKCLKNKIVAVKVEMINSIEYRSCPRWWAENKWMTIKYKVYKNK